MKAITLLFLALLFGTSCQPNGKNYCAKLRNIASDPEVLQSIKAFSEANVVQQRVSLTDVTTRKALLPSVRLKESIPFDWSAFGFDPRYRDVGLLLHELDVGESNMAKVASYFFAERPRYGILLRVSDNWGIGEDLQDLEIVAEDIAVLCLPGD